MKIVQKGIITASFMAGLAVSASALAAPPGKADYNFDPAAENASRNGEGVGGGYGYSYGYANPYAGYGSFGTGYYDQGYYEPGAITSSGYRVGGEPDYEW